MRVRWRVALMATAVESFACWASAQPAPAAPPTASAGIQAPVVQPPLIQEPPVASATAALAPPVRIPAGTRVYIAIVDSISTTTIKRGDRFNIRLTDPLVFQGQTVVAAGALGVGEVIDAAPGGMLGRPAKLLLAARYLSVKGVRIPLRSMQLGGSGQDETNTVLALSIAVGPLAGFIRGGEIEIPAGTGARAKLATDIDPATLSAPEAPVANTPAPAQPIEGKNP